MVSKPKEGGRKSNKESTPRITADLYNKMWDAYQERQSARHVSKTVGCDIATALRYINGPGAPDVGMEPIRDRWLRVQAAAQEEQELSVLSLRRTEIDWARKQLLALHGEMELAVADVRRRVNEYKAAGGSSTPSRELDLEKLVAAYDKAVRTAEHLLGGPDVSVEKRAGFDPLATLDEDEARIYATTGVLPESVRQMAAVAVPRRSK